MFVLLSNGDEMVEGEVLFSDKRVGDPTSRFSDPIYDIVGSKEEAEKIRRNMIKIGFLNEDGSSKVKTRY